MDTYTELDYLHDIRDDRPGDHKQWTVGGTSITNFGNASLDIYRKAISIYHDSVKVEILGIRNEAYDTFGRPLEDHSCLYFVNREALLELKDGLSPFWRIFDELQASANK